MPKKRHPTVYLRTGRSEDRIGPLTITTRETNRHPDWQPGYNAHSRPSESIGEDSMGRIYCEVCNEKCKPLFENTCCSVACASVVKERKMFLKRVLEHFDELEVNGVVQEFKLEKAFASRGELYYRKAHEALNKLLYTAVLQRSCGNIFQRDRLNIDSKLQPANEPAALEGLKRGEIYKNMEISHLPLSPVAPPVRLPSISNGVSVGMICVADENENMKWVPQSKKEEEKLMAETRLDVAMAAEHSDPTFAPGAKSKRAQLLDLMEEFNEEEMEMMFRYRKAQTAYRAAKHNVHDAEQLLKEQQKQLEKASEELADLRTKLAERAVESKKEEDGKK